MKLGYGERIRELRTAHGMSLREVGERIDATGSAVSWWESERAMPGALKLFELAALFDVTMEYILMGIEGEQR